MSARLAYSETVLEVEKEAGANVTEFQTCFASLRTPMWKLIWDRFEDSFALYDLARDPGERKDVSANHRDVMASLSSDLQSMAQTMPTGVEAPNKAVIDRLKSLGYL